MDENHGNLTTAGLFNQDVGGDPALNLGFNFAEDVRLGRNRLPRGFTVSIFVHRFHFTKNIGLLSHGLADLTPLGIGDDRLSFAEYVSTPAEAWIDCRLLRLLGPTQTATPRERNVQTACKKPLRIRNLRFMGNATPPNLRLDQQICLRRFTPYNRRATRPFINS